MEAIDRKDKSFEETIGDLIRINKVGTDWEDENKKLIRIRRKDRKFMKKVLIKRLRAEMRKYLTRADQCAEQIYYIRERIHHIQEYVNILDRRDSFDKKQ